jgi:hypothetical protein
LAAQYASDGPESVIVYFGFISFGKRSPRAFIAILIKGFLGFETLCQP